MNSLSNKEYLLRAFGDYLQESLSFGPSKADEYKLAARQFIEYLQRQPGGHLWLRQLRNEQALLNFINSEFQTDNEETQNTKKVAGQAFQQYLKKNGWLVLPAVWVRESQNRPLIVLLGAFLGLIAILQSLGLPQVNVIGALFPSNTPTITSTPTITNTPTITLTPSPTLTLTPTLTPTPTVTPTPNSTQVFLATQLPTANPAFTPQVRIHSGKEQVFVPAGSFFSGNPSGTADSMEVMHQVYTDSFWIDRFLVTNSEFTQCPAKKMRSATKFCLPQTSERLFWCS